MTKNVILFDDKDRGDLLPLTYTRPVSEIRVGILKIREKWEKMTSHEFSFLTEDYLKTKYPIKICRDNLLINGGIIPNINLTDEISKLKSGELLFKNDTIIAGVFNKPDVETFDIRSFDNFNKIEAISNYTKINYPWDIFQYNGQEIENDFLLITKDRESQQINSSNYVVESDRVFIEEGAIVNFTSLNPQGGYIYIGKDAEIMEGCRIRGSLALCENSTIKMGAKIYGATTFGPHCKVGGEIKNSVILGYSNKGHDGYLGNAVLGEWCNIGADTNNSNLKNNYSEVKLWNYPQKRFIKSGLQYCGLIMGDHSKCGINTMFNTGTVVGVSANIFGSGFPRNFIPSFSWGGASGFTTYTLDKANETAGLVTKRRNIPFDKQERKIFENIFELSKEFRK